jgi:hypothetical protein
MEIPLVSGFRNLKILQRELIDPFPYVLIAPQTASPWDQKTKYKKFN